MLTDNGGVLFRAHDVGAGCDFAGCDFAGCDLAANAAGPGEVGGRTTTTQPAFWW